LCDNLLLQKNEQSLCENTVFLCVNLIDPDGSEDEEEEEGEDGEEGDDGSECSGGEMEGTEDEEEMETMVMDENNNETRYVLTLSVSFSFFRFIMVYLKLNGAFWANCTIFKK